MEDIQSGTETEKCNFRVYDVPLYVIRGLIAYSRIHNDGKVGDSLTKAYELLMAEEKGIHGVIPDLLDKIQALESRINDMEENPESNEIHLLGGGKVST